MINFQTGFISRFISLQETRENFLALFGSGDVMEKILRLQPSKRAEASLNKYCTRLKQAGDFQFVTPAIILRPESNRTHFHLIYATKHPKGVEVFKDAERKSVPLMHKVRADAQSRRRVQRKGQLELLPSQDMYNFSYYDSLRNRYCGPAKERIKTILQQRHSDLLFLKMADEQNRPPFNKASAVPAGYDWPSLLARDGDELEIHYRHLLETLGKQKGMLGVIF